MYPANANQRPRFYVNITKYLSIAELLKTKSYLSAIMFMILAIQLGLSIASILLQNEYHPSKAICMGTYDAISFGYQKWLIIFGWTGIGIVAAIVAGLVCSLATEIKDSMEEFVNRIAGLGYLFQFAWYIVGAILYFKTIHNDCLSGHIIHDYGLSVFIIETVVIGCLVCSPKKNPSVEEVHVAHV